MAKRVVGVSLCAQLGRQFGWPFGNSDGNSQAIPGNSETIPAIRMFSEESKIREYGNSAPRQFAFIYKFKKGNGAPGRGISRMGQKMYAWDACLF